jgi:hypothetical protein
MGDIILDGRRNETMLYFGLRNRFIWDVIKLIISASYIVVIIAMLLGYIPIPTEYEIYIPNFTWGTLIVTLIIITFQIKNIIHFKGNILEKAGRIADKHAKISE